MATAAARSSAAMSRRWLSSSSRLGSLPRSPSALQAEMQARGATAIGDVLSPMPSHLLDIALSDFLPAEGAPAGDLFDSQGAAGSAPAPALPQGHHLVYFPLQLPASRLMADGTDPAHWPGEPFGRRRMWAGGSVRFAPGWADVLRLDGRRAVCVEAVGDVALPSPDRVFVDVWRRYGSAGAGAGAAVEPAAPAIEERRTLVFMSELPARDGTRIVKGACDVG